jgi:hypothetical protein
LDNRKVENQYLIYCIVVSEKNDVFTKTKPSPCKIQIYFLWGKTGRHNLGFTKEVVWMADAGVVNCSYNQYPAISTVHGIVPISIGLCAVFIGLFAYGNVSKGKLVKNDFFPGN